MNKNNIDELRITYSSFIFHDYKIMMYPKGVRILYYFEIENLKTFTPSYFISEDYFKSFDVSDKVLNDLVFSLGLVELVSYYKATCAKKVIIECGVLDEKQINWWKKLYYRGLGEFFYHNNITLSFDEFMHIECRNKCIHEGNQLNKKLEKSILLPIGGGKDSIVSLEILKKQPLNIHTFMINPHPTTINSSLTAFNGEDKVIGITRQLDKGIIELNNEGFLNGHTPFSAVVAFSSALMAYVNNMKYIILSNEDSANESSVKNSDVNHQYSKSFEFEEDFRNYLGTYINPDLNYFSLLRPLSEYQIGKYFASLNQYFMVFKSCNVGSKNDEWCNNCSKCLYVYILLSAFLNQEQMFEIFKENLLERVDLYSIFEQLIGLKDEKPFECVGSYNEINFAIIDGINRKPEKLPYMYETYMKLPLYHEYKNKDNPYINYYNEHHNLEKIFDELIRKEMNIHA